MTTPGGGGGEGNNNEIVVGVGFEVQGDAETVIRSEGQKAAEAWAEGVQSVGAPSLRLPGMDDLYAQYDTTLDRIETRVKEAARNMGLALEQGNPGAQGLFGQELEQEMQRYQALMESYGGRIARGFSGSFREALRAEALNPEGLEFLRSAGQPTSESQRSQFFQETTFPTPPQGGFHGTGGYEPGDLDRVRQAGQAALSRVVLDDATYAFENGQFFRVSKSGGVLRANGGVDNPELNQRLQAALSSQMAAVENQIVAEHIRDMASRPGTPFSEYGIDPGRQYGTGGAAALPGTDVGAIVTEAGTGIEGLVSALETLRAIGLQAPEVLDALSTSLHGLVVAADEAARAEESAALEQRATAEQRAALAATQARLEGAFSGGLRTVHDVPDELHGLVTPQEAGQAEYLAMLTARREMREQAEAEARAQAEIARAAEAERRASIEAYQAKRAAEPPADDSYWVAQRQRVAEGQARVRQQLLDAGHDPDAFFAKMQADASKVDQGRAYGATGGLTDDESARNQEKLNAALSHTIELTGQETAAELELMSALRKRQDAELSGDPGKLASAMRAVDRAQSRVEDENAGPAQQRSFLGAAFHAAMGGDKSDDADNAHFRLNADNGEFLGAIARYQAAYAVIFGLSQALHSMVSDEEASQTAMIEFGEATGLTGQKADDLAESLLNVGAAAGLAASQTIEAATKGMFAFGSEVTNPDGSKNPQAVADVARQSVQAASIAAVITRAKDAAVAQNQLVAATLSFNLSAADQTRVLDAAANAARHYGGATGDILAGLPGVAAIAHQAGLSVEETSNLIAVAASRTAQTGTAVSTAIGRVLENLNSKPQTKSLLDSFGIDTTGTAGQTLEDLARRWKDLTTAQQDQVVASLGGVRAARDLLPILQEGDGIIRATEESYKEAGYAQERYYAQLHTLGGVLKTIGGDVGLISHDLANSGLFSVLGPVLAAVDPLLKGLDDILKVIGALNDASGGWLIPLLEIAGVIALINKELVTTATTEATVVAETSVEATTRTGGLLGRIVPFRGGGPVPVGVARRELTPLEALGNPMTGQEAVRLGEQGEIAAGETGALAGGTAAGGALLPLAAAAILATVAIGSIKGAIDNEREAREASTNALRTLGTSGSDPESFRNAASQLATAAAQREHANSGFGGLFAASSADRAAPDYLRQQAAYANQEANRLEAEQRAAGSSGTVDLYFTHTKDVVADLTNGITAMASAAVPAVRQLQLVTQAINAIGGEGQPTGVLRTESSISAFTSAALGAFPKGIRGANGEVVVEGPQVNPYGGVTAPITASDLLDSKTTQEAITKVLDDNKVAPGEVITPEIRDKMVDAILRANGFEGGKNGKGIDATDAIKAQLQQALLQGGSLAGKGNQFEGLSQSDFNTLISGDQGKGTTGLLAYLKAQGGSKNPLALNSTIGPLQGELDALLALKSKAEAANLTVPTAVLDQINQVTSDLVDAQIKGAELVRQHALQGVTSPAQIARINSRSYQSEANTAIKAQDATALLGVLDAADQATRDVIRHALTVALQVAQDAYDRAEALYNADVAAWNSIPANIRAHDPDLQGLRPGSAPDSAGVTAAKANLGLFDTTASKVTTGPDGANSTDPNQLALAQINAQADSRNAVQTARVAVQAAQYSYDHAKNATERATALKQLNDANDALLAALATYSQAVQGASVRQGDPLSAATAALHQADTALQATERGTTAWFQALTSFQSAQYAYGQAVLARQHEQRTNHLDITDPVATAREQLIADAARLAADRKNGTGDLAADTNAVRTDQNTLEAAAFSQRLHDVQFAHDQGTLSEQAYIAYLDSEHNRLTRIAHRTRQQTEELQQIDSAIKAETDAMQGQFNLGDIKVPTPYEVRRYMALQGGSGTTTSAINNSQTTIQINGADLAAVRALINQAIGSSATTRVTVSTRKVP